MFFQQFKVGGLGCLSYMIGCPQDGRVVVVDPKRDIKDYLVTAKQNKMKISHIIETHVHADHVSGALELQQATGAPIHLGAGSPVFYDHVQFNEGDIINIGSVKMQVIFTPGHTPQSISLAIADLSRGELPQMLLTGDLLFVGSIGRPDLAGSEMLNEQIKNLYNSLYTKLSRFGDYVEIYPAHGEGSLCGAGLSAKPSSTLGYERQTNPYLKLSREEFKKAIEQSQPHRPQNFSYIIESNRQGAIIEEELPVPRQKNPAAIARYLQDPEQYALVDLREAVAFGGAHIPGSLNIGMSPNSATWMGNVVDPEKKIVLLADSQEQIFQAISSFRRVGYNQIIGYSIGLSDWILSGRKTGFLPQISVHALQEVLTKYGNHTVIDVRTPAEWEEGHLENAIHLPLPQLITAGITLDQDTHISVICGSGYRSNIAGSILKTNGYEHVYSVIGGMMAWRMAGFKMAL
ncbi:MAG: rhodanese-like domain-containing protein [Pseudomonadota bacterium]|nr:rhodanese-like domain-containing protein [Pseudomonadota bacterium]